MQKLSDWIRHFFHVVSNVRPLVWMGLYVLCVPVFALVYWWLPDAQFRIPDGAGTDFGSWLYYSIVTITTLGFGDYTPAHGWAQAVTAIEVMCGLVYLGFFLNAVGSMKSEIDVSSEVEKQRRAHFEMEKSRLVSGEPALIHVLDDFLAYCYAVTTPLGKRVAGGGYNPDFAVSDMRDMFKPSGLSFDTTSLPAVSRLVNCAVRVSLTLDSLQNRVDLSLWPAILDDCFAFVAGVQMFSSADSLSGKPSALLPAEGAESGTKAEEQLSAQIGAWQGAPDMNAGGALRPVFELYYFIRENASLALKLESALAEARTGTAG